MTDNAAPITWEAPQTRGGQAKPKRIVVFASDARSPDLWERIQREIPHQVSDTANWQTHALCSTVDPELWFPEKGSTPGAYVSARDICAQCPVRRECLEAALDNNEMYGVWGGFSPSERRIIRRSRELYLRREQQRRGAVPAAHGRREHAG